jgi:hypothetical protein
MVTERIYGVRFDERPPVHDRRDAMELLDILIEADFTENLFFAMEALRDAIERKAV